MGLGAHAGMLSSFLSELKISYIDRANPFVLFGLASFTVSFDKSYRKCYTYGKFVTKMFYGMRWREPVGCKSFHLIPYS
jgi:hypothetical protein